MDKVKNELWNLGDGLPNVCNSVMRKLQYAGYQLESRNRTIVNLESYEVTAMIWALTEYMKRRRMKTSGIITECCQENGKRFE